MGNTKAISIFVDESGSFAPECADKASRHYILCMVFHDQRTDINDEIRHLENCLTAQGLDSKASVHAGPLIRREKEYANMSREERRGIFQRMLAFVRTVDITYRCFEIDKHFNTKDQAIHDSLLQQLLTFLVRNMDEFNAYDKLKIYYDNGQEQVTKLLKEAFALFSSRVEFVPNVTPENYRLFQAADLACTLELVKTKLLATGKLSESERTFFGGEKAFRKNYLKILERKLHA